MQDGAGTGSTEGRAEGPCSVHPALLPLPGSQNSFHHHFNLPAYTEHGISSACEGVTEQSPGCSCREWVLLLGQGQRAGGSSCSSGRDWGGLGNGSAGSLTGNFQARWQAEVANRDTSRTGSPQLCGEAGDAGGEKKPGGISSRNFALSHKNPH